MHNASKNNKISLHIVCISTFFKLLFLFVLHQIFVNFLLNLQLYKNIQFILSSFVFTIF